jgi:N-acetyl-anhydromuramyl-L-alanine amidase AmpD
MTARTKTEPPSHTTHIVRNQSSRNGRNVSAVAVHSTESQDRPGTTADLVAIRNWFDNPASQASSHIGIDGAGNTELWVHSDKKAWTILDLNSVTCNIEFIARAAQSTSEWEEAQIKQGARWAAYWCVRYGLPAQRGIITHKQLTDAGFGSHTDPGAGFPMARFIELTQYYRRNGWAA